MKGLKFFGAAVAAIVPVIVPAAYAWTAKSMTGWDCCKPTCSWQPSLNAARASGAVKVCNKQDRPLSARQGLTEMSACEERDAGNGYLCSSFQPRPLSNDLSIGFAILGEESDCCKCFELQWLDGPARGKRMQVQQINTGAENGDVIIVVPGGGVGPNSKGCQSQFGYGWGRQYGGVDSADDCEALPENMRGGCYWRWNWARGDINGWPINVKSVGCPQTLKDISGCSN